MGLCLNVMTAAVLAVAAAPAAAFDQWWDPDLEDGVRLAGCIVVAKVASHEVGDEEGVFGPPVVTVLQVERVLRGTMKPGDTLRLRRIPSHHFKTTRPDPDARVLVFARKQDDEWKELTSSWGVFKMDGDTTAYLPIRDPFAQVPVDLKVLEPWFKLWHAPKRDPKQVAAVVDPLVTAAAKTEPGTKQLPDVQAQIRALEVCYVLGRPEDGPKLAKFLTSPYFHVRRSAARALGTTGGEGVEAALVAQLQREEAASVRSDLARALFRIGAASDATKQAVTAAIATWTAELEDPEDAGDSVGLSSNLMDGRLNAVPSPILGLKAVLQQAEGNPGTFRELAKWRGHEWRDRR